MTQDAKAGTGDETAEASPPPEPGRIGQLGGFGSLLANVLIFAVVGFALCTHTYETSTLDFLGKMIAAPGDLPGAEPSDFYYQSVQEDEYLEWATFWGFAFAAFVGWFAAWRQWRSVRQVPWFLVGVGLFSLVFALEEISWGQRVFSYRPPVYFLEHNFQQEFNVHNVIGTSTRKLLLKIIILSYGVVLPALALFPPIRRIFARTAVVVPPVATIPAFYVAYHLYQFYPWKFTGELVELMLAFGFLFAAVEAVASCTPGSRARSAPATRTSCARHSRRRRPSGATSSRWRGGSVVG
jgi:hypothetical protein